MIFVIKLIHYAFRYGYSIPKLYYVVHYGMPCSMDKFAQETGRIGRDNLQSHSIVLVHKAANLDSNMSNNCKEYSSTSKCLKTLLLDFFDETPVENVPGHLCGSNCSVEYACCSCQEASNCLHLHHSISCNCVRLCYSLPLPYKDMPPLGNENRSNLMTLCRLKFR